MNKKNLLKVLEIGDKRLREKAKEIEDINDPEIQKLIKDLIKTVKKVNGVGISAPQVGYPIKLFIIASYPNERYPYAPKMKPTSMINPIITYYSEEKAKDWEGCLSVPGIRALVPRHKIIKVEYYNKTGKFIKKTFSNFVARIFQHEYDHLEGLVYLDRIESVKDIVSEQEFRKIVKKRNEKSKK